MKHISRLRKPLRQIGAVPLNMRYSSKTFKSYITRKPLAQYRNTEAIVAADELDPSQPFQADITALSIPETSAAISSDEMSQPRSYHSVIAESAPMRANSST